MFRRTSLLSTIYVIVGLFVASNHDYLDNVDTLREIVSAVLAIFLWPLVLLDVNLHVR